MLSLISRYHIRNGLQHQFLQALHFEQTVFIKNASLKEGYEMKAVSDCRVLVSVPTSLDENFARSWMFGCSLDEVHTL